MNDHDGCIRASRFDKEAHTHPDGPGYYAPREVVITKAATYSLSTDNFRRMMGITERGVMIISHDSQTVTVTVDK
jgi:hypothetical protein